MTSSGTSTISSNSNTTTKSSKYGLFRKSNKGQHRNSSKNNNNNNNSSTTSSSTSKNNNNNDNPTQQLLVHTSPDDLLFDSSRAVSGVGTTTTGNDYRSQSRHRSRETSNRSTEDSIHLNTNTNTSNNAAMNVRVRERSESPHSRSRIGSGSGSGGGGFMARIRSRSRSRSRSRRGGGNNNNDNSDTDALSVTSMDSASSSGSSSSSSMVGGSMIVTVTSCRSDAYFSQKAPGATTKVPRKAPSALKLFHELAVGVKDAYAAIGATPTRPDNNNNTLNNNNNPHAEGQAILWEFMGNLDFLLALVDEVATDTATRGALKDDVTFKSLRDVIKKCNKVLESMLVRRERKYTLFFRLVQPNDDLKKIAIWNKKVEDAVGAVTSSSTTSAKNNNNNNSHHDTTSEAGSVDTNSSSGSGMFKRRRGRSLLPGSGKLRSRRATPTPSLRSKFLSPSSSGSSSNNSTNNNNNNNNNNNSSISSSAEDGFSTVTAPVTTKNLAKLQQALNDSPSSSSSSNHHHHNAILNDLHNHHQHLTQSAANNNSNNNNNNNLLQPKDELVDVIRGLQTEKLLKQQQQQNQQNQNDANNPMTTSPSDLKPNWLPKADIPSAVPKLPVEYIHRHRLMKQVVNCLLDKSTTTTNNNNNNNNNSSSTANPSSSTTNNNNMMIGVDNNNNYYHNYQWITSITSRHADKAGNGKTTLAVAAIQTVEIRERFCDGIAWLQLGRSPLTEKDVRRLYEELHHQLLIMDDIHTTHTSHTNNNNSNASRKRFQGGELEGLKEDIGRKIQHRKVLICLDDVWRMEDAKWFLFHNSNNNSNSSNNSHQEEHKYPEDTPHRILLTTRTPTLLGPPPVSSGKSSSSNHNNNYPAPQEVFVRIFSEHEAVKLLLSSAGRRVYGGKNSPVFHQARVIVKGCGNSPLALRLAGGMLRTSNRNWTLSSPTWIALVDQCRSNLEEASRIRSFVHSVGRIVDLIFATVPDLETRALLRKCFVTFAMVFHNNDWVLTGKGIPKGVILTLFQTIIIDTTTTTTTVVDHHHHSSNNSPTSSDEGFHNVTTTNNNISNNNNHHTNTTTNNSSLLSADTLLELLEHMNLLQRARHGAKPPSLTYDETKDMTTATNNTTSNNNSSNNNNGSSMGASSERSMCVDEDDVGTAENPSFLMHESVKYIAEEMATRTTPSFAPIADDYTTFTDQLEEEVSQMMYLNSGVGGGTKSSSHQKGWFRAAANYIFQPKDNNNTTNNAYNNNNNNNEQGTPEYRFHQLMVTSLLQNPSTGNNNNNVSSNKNRMEEDWGSRIVPLVQQTCSSSKQSKKQNNQHQHQNQHQPLDDGRMEKYLAAYLPTHLIRAKWYNAAGAILCDEHFIQRRVAALGSVEATRRQMLDLHDLRHNPPPTTLPTSSRPTTNDNINTSTEHELSSPHSNPDDTNNNSEPLDMNVIKRDACRLIIDEVYRVMDVTTTTTSTTTSTNNNSISSQQQHSNEKSLNMAICLSTVGEGLLKSKQPRDAMLRLEEAVGIYRGLLGPYHVDVARAIHSVAKALLKLGETETAFAQLEQATRIFDNATVVTTTTGSNTVKVASSSHHYDAIAMGQTMAQLLVEMGRYDQAQTKYQDILHRRIQVYGTHSLPVAKTMNDYAVVLAKHAQLDASLIQYTEARHIYQFLQQQQQQQQQQTTNNNTLLSSSSTTADSNTNLLLSKYDFDITLIDLNIASIKSKKGDYKGAIAFYQQGVTGLKRHIEQETALMEQSSNNNNNSHHHSHNHHNNNTNSSLENVKLVTQKRHLVSAIGRIGSLKMKLGDNTGALEAYLTLLHEVHEDSSPSSSLMEKAKAHVKCATIYRQSTSSQDANYHAISHLEKAFHMYTRLHGPNHKDTQAIASSLRQWKLQTTSYSEDEDDHDDHDMDDMNDNNNNNNLHNNLRHHHSNDTYND